MIFFFLIKILFLIIFLLINQLVGGGGYTIRNVARCWTHETACMLDINLPDDLPHNEYIEFVIYFFLNFFIKTKFIFF